MLSDPVPDRVKSEKMIWDTRGIAEAYQKRIQSVKLQLHMIGPCSVGIIFQLCTSFVRHTFLAMRQRADIKTLKLPTVTTSKLALPACLIAYLEFMVLIVAQSTGPN